MHARIRLTLAVAFAAVTACSTREASAPEADVSGDAMVVAEVSGKAVTLPELETWIKEDMFRHEMTNKSASELYELRADALDRMVSEQLIAAEGKRLGMKPEDLMRTEQQKEVVITDAEVAEFFEKNKARVGGQTLEQLSPRIKSHLEDKKRQESWKAYVDALREKANVVVKLEQPRVQVGAQGPAKGPEGAEVTIVEFSDFQCPFCRKAEPTVNEVLARYGDKVRLVFRHFPLEMHSRARPAAEAAACADQQGKFWEYKEKLFAGGPLEDADLLRYGTELGLDSQVFELCVTDRKTKDVVDADFAAGKAAGVSGTPAFFVNGVMLSGARPVDAFVNVIDRELEKRPAAGR
jgi:protein-disulfide isomerase